MNSELQLRRDFIFVNKVTSDSHLLATKYQDLFEKSSEGGDSRCTGNAFDQIRWLKSGARGGGGVTVSTCVLEDMHMSFVLVRMSKSVEWMCEAFFGTACRFPASAE